ncbi:MAG: hypothetical protein ACK5Q5_01885 [Planctomycetaceae bacterium]
MSTRSSPPDDPVTLSATTANSPETEGLPEEFILTPDLVEDEAIRGDIVLRGAVILLATLFAWTQITSPAVLTRIRTGQELASHGFLPPRTDTFFSYTAGDRPWVNLGWLGDLLLAGWYGLGGAAALSVFSGLAAGITFWLVGRTSVRRAPTWWGSLCAGLAVLALFPLLTAGPTLMTVVGLAVCLNLIQRGTAEPTGRWWWGLSPTMLLWSNLDPHAYLGLLLIGLFMVGRLFSSNSEPSTSIKPLLVALLAGLIHPFPLGVLQAPITHTRQLHPLWLQFGGGDAGEYLYLYVPVFDAFQKFRLSWHLLAVLVLAGLSIVSLVLNRRQLSWGEVFAWLGLNLIGLTSGIDFTAVALVNAVFANLNGQRWYLANCRQEYTLNKGELFLSRAGRAVTVLALFAAAYWGLSGWMTGAAGRRVGFGFSHALSRQIEGYGKLLGEEGVDEYDNHPFHLTAAQGDILNWLGRKTFTDSRLLLFAAEGHDNLLEKQQALAASLRSPDQPLSSSEAILEWARSWQKSLDEYKITHIVVPLETADGYRLWVNLASQGMATDQGDVARFWMPAGINGPAAVLYRLELISRQHRDDYLAFLRKRGHSSIVQETFRQADAPDSPQRGVFPRGPTFYETSLLLPQPVVPNDSLVARHYMTRLGAAERPLFETVAYAHQIVRHARRGLAENPNSFESYLLLAEAYQHLWRVELSTAANRLGMDAADRRFLQTVFALHHASQCQPQSVAPHALLFPLYLEHGDYDLALLHVDRIFELTGRYSLLSRDDPNYDASYQQAKRVREQLAAALETAQSAVEQAQVGGLESSVRTALQMQCPNLALQLLEKDLTLTINSPELSLQYARLLLISGRTLDALQQFERQLSLVEGTAAAQNLQPLAALANLAADEYARAYDLWDQFGTRRLQETFNTYSGSLPMSSSLGEQVDSWPILQIMTSAQAMGQLIPDWELSRWQMAMNELETGRNQSAEKLLEEVLASNPQSLLRPQMAMYLTLLTGQSIEPFLPPEPGESLEGSRPTDRPPSPALPTGP